MRYFFPIVLLLTALGLGTYVYLGGLRTPTVTLESPAAPVLLAGQPYRGRVQEPRFGELFRAAKQRLDAGSGAAGGGWALANIYYHYPTGPQDTLRAFIGHTVADTAAPLPAGWRYRAVPAGQPAVVARLAGTSFQLAPAKLEKAALDYITSRQLTRQPFYYEQFGPGAASELRVGVAPGAPPKAGPPAGAAPANK